MVLSRRWYSTGTVSVTNGSATVTGATTGWTSQAKPGDMLTTDRSVFYEVQSVDSNTQITLAQAYAGSTASGQGYYIIRVSPAWNDASDAAVKLAAYLDEIANPAATAVSAGLAYKFNVATSGDPGSGKLSLNHATPSLAAGFSISKTGGAGESLGAYISSWDDSTNGHRGHVRVYDVADRTKFLEIEITGSCIDNTTYWQFPCTAIGVLPANNADISVSFERTGNQGADSDVPGPANELEIGTVTTGAAGSSASATITGTPPTQTLNLTIPRGDTGLTGPANSLGVGTVTTGAAGSSASASITGTPPSQTLALTIPRGDTGAGYGGTSTTSLTIGTGAKSFTTQAGLAWVVGNRITLAEGGGTATMTGFVSAYSGTSMTVESAAVVGSGTFTSWVLGPPVGAPGAGAVTSVNAATGAVQVFNSADVDPITIGGFSVSPIVFDFALNAQFGVRNDDGVLWSIGNGFIDDLLLHIQQELQTIPDMHATTVPLIMAGGQVAEAYDEHEHVVIGGLPRIPHVPQVAAARAGSAFVPTQWNGFITWLQSNGAGVGYTSVVSATGFYPSNAITFTNGPRADDTASAFNGTAALFETTANGSQQGTPTSNAGESPTTGIAFRWLEDGIRAGNWSLSSAPILFGSAAGVGGSGVDAFKASGTFWSRFQNNVTNQKARATAASKTFSIPLVVLIGSETDAETDTKSRATITSDWGTVYTDTNTYVKAQTGQSSDIVAIAMQTSYGVRRPNQPGAVALGIYDWQNSDTKVIAGPMYPYDWTDQYHPTAIGRRLIGEKIGQVAKQVISDHKQWTGLRPRQAWVKGAEIYIRFYVPYPPMTLDDWGVRKVTDYGFKVTDGGGTKTITDIRAVSADVLKITVSAACSGTTTIRYALDYLYANNPVFDPTYGAAGNLRDSDPARLSYGGKDYPMFNWAQHFSITGDLLQTTVS